LIGRCDTDAAFANMYSDQLKDLFNQLPDPGQNNTLMASLFRNNLRIFEKRLAANNGFLAGNSVSYADLFLSSILDNLKEQKNQVVKEFPKVLELDRKITSNQRIRDYLLSRPPLIY
jgi:glutathione S-transferase